MKSDTYVKNRVQNMFTAYLLKAVEKTRKKYLDREDKIKVHEKFLHDSQSAEPYQSFEEFIEKQYREEQVRVGEPGQFFCGLENDRLLKAVKLLKDSEREIIYLHVFEEKTFREIASDQNEKESTIKGRYYYALSKIKKQMERGKEE